MVCPVDDSQDWQGFARTYFAGDDIEQVPALEESARRIRNVLYAAGALVAAAVVVFMIWTRRIACFVWLVPFPFVAPVARWMSRRWLRRRLATMARSSRDAKRAAAESGELVRLRGRVRALRTTAGLTARTPAVAFRTEVSLPPSLAAGARQWGAPPAIVHERAHDFLLEDEGSGEVVRVIVKDGLLYGAADRSGIASADELRSTLATGDVRIPEHTVDVLEGHLEMRELVIEEGDRVEVIGRKVERTDPDMAERLPRESPLRVCIEGDSGTPLLVVPLAGERAAL
jgi:hypothetical protein